MDWFLYDRELRHEKVREIEIIGPGQTSMMGIFEKIVDSCYLLSSLNAPSWTFDRVVNKSLFSSVTFYFAKRKKKHVKYKQLFPLLIVTPNDAMGKLYCVKLLQLHACIS